MNFSSHFQPLAHAYLIEGHHVTVVDELISFLEQEHGLILKNNSDVWKGTFETLTIEQAREIKELASNKKMTDGKRMFIVSMGAITREASNALLKTLEEPSEGTHFFLIMPSARRVLPTILSRVRLVRHPSKKEIEFVSPEVFFKLSPGERLKKVKDLLGRVEKEEASKGEVVAFIETLVEYLHAKKKDVSLQKEVVAASYALDQSASLKMLLEYIALTA